MCGAIVSVSHSLSVKCDAIVSDRHSPKAIATGCADPSHKYTTLWEEFIDLWEARLAANFRLSTNREQSHRIGVPCKTETIAPHIHVLLAIYRSS